MTTFVPPPPGYRRLAGASGLSIVVLDEPALPGELLCDGMELVPSPPARCGTVSTWRDGREHRIGDRLYNPESGLSVMCSRSGSGDLTFNGRPLRLKPRIRNRPVSGTR